MKTVTSGEFAKELSIALNEASRHAMDDFELRYVDKYEDHDSVRSPGWYEAVCNFWVSGMDGRCCWSTTGGEPNVDDAINEHIREEHTPLGVRVGQSHRKLLDAWVRINDNPERKFDALLHAAWTWQRNMLLVIAEAYGIEVSAW